MLARSPESIQQTDPYRCSLQPSEIATEKVPTHLTDVGRLSLQYSLASDIGGNFFANPSPVIDRLVADHFVKPAPEFRQQANQLQRTNLFRYGSGLKPPKTEQQGLQELEQFLDTFTEVVYADRSTPALTHKYDEELAATADDIHEHLSFIGRSEFLEAAAGLAELWKNYLYEDSAHQLCVTADIDRSCWGETQRKSDSYLLDHILLHFNDQELAYFEGRLLRDPKKISAPPEQSRIVLLDDWTVSGSQIQHVYGAYAAQPWFEKYSQSIELNLVVASTERLRRGFKVGQDTPRRLPVRAYFQSHLAEHYTKDHQAHVSGVHSSVDYDFEEPLHEMATRLKVLLPDSTGRPPALAEIIRPYRNTEPVFETTDGRVRRSARMLGKMLVTT